MVVHCTYDLRIIRSAAIIAGLRDRDDDHYYYSLVLLRHLRDRGGHPRVVVPSVTGAEGEARPTSARTTTAVVYV